VSKRTKILPSNFYADFVSRFPRRALVPKRGPPTVHPGEVGIGISRFSRHTPNFDHEIWERAVSLTLANAPRSFTMSFDDAVQSAIHATGDKFVTGIWSRFADQTKSKRSALANPECIALIKHNIVNRKFSSYTVALKDEQLVPEKVRRLFMPVGLDVLVCCHMVFNRWLDQCQQLEDLGGINYSSKDNPRVVNQMGENLFRYGASQASTDASSADSTIRAAHKRPVYSVVSSLISSEPTGLEDLFDVDGKPFDFSVVRSALDEFLIQPSVHLPNGSIVTIEGNASGGYRTLIDNSIIFASSVRYALLRCDPAFASLLNLYFRVTGDDVIMSGNYEQFEEWLKFYLSMCNELGFIIGTIEHGFSSEFCGFVFRTISDAGTSLYRRVVADPFKCLDPIINNRSEGDYAVSCDICQSLLITFWWDPVTREWLQAFRAFLSEYAVKEHLVSYTWMHDSKIVALQSPARLVFETVSCVIYNSVLKMSLPNAKKSLPKKKKGPKQPKPRSSAPYVVQAASRAPQQRRIMVKAASGYESRYGDYLRDATIATGGPADGARYAEVRAIKLDEAINGATAASKYNILFALDSLRPAIHKFVQDVTAAGVFVYKGDLSLSGVIALEDYNDVRLSSAQGVIASETVDAGSNVVSGHFHALQTGSIDDFSSITEDELRAREVGIIMETPDALSPAASYFIPTEKSMTPRPLISQATRPASDDKVFVFDVIDGTSSDDTLNNTSLA